jgi:hypothetical protein
MPFKIYAFALMGGHAEGNKILEEIRVKSFRHAFVEKMLQQHVFATNTELLPPAARAGDLFLEGSLP